MDKPLLPPLAPAPAQADPIAALGAVPDAPGLVALLPAILAIGGAAGDEVAIGAADRTPWLAMAAAQAQPAPRIGNPQLEQGKIGERAPVARRARAGRYKPGPEAECSAGVCVCGRCQQVARRP